MGAGESSSSGVNSHNISLSLRERREELDSIEIHDLNERMQPYEGEQNANTEDKPGTEASYETLPNSEALVDPNAIATNGTVINDDEDLERIVRSQVDFAASDWATLNPQEHRANLNQHIEQLNLLSSYRERKLLEGDTKMKVEHRQFYPNHNYQYDQESSGPFRDFMPAQLEPKTTPWDPMTTSSSDGLDKYASHVQPASYVYRSRGPISSSTTDSNDVGSDNAKRLWYATSSTTLAPRIMLAFQRLDSRKNSSSPRSSYYSGKRGPRPDNYKLPGHQSSESSLNRLNLISDTSQQHPQGFMDEPHLTIVSNSQQPPNEPSASTADLPSPTSSSSSSLIRDLQTNYRLQSRLTGNEVNQESIVPLSDRAITKSETTTLQSNSTSRSRPELLPANVVVDGSRNQAKTTAARISEQDLASNLNGNLAARLNANRYKNSPGRASSGMSRTQVDTGELRDPRAQPLSVNILAQKQQQQQHTKLEAKANETARPASTSIRWPQTTTTAATIPASSSSNRVTSWRQTTIPLSSATANPNLLADSVNAKELALDESLLKNAAHHHHLHSHVHSIKPAVITIPIQQHRHHQEQATSLSKLASAANGSNGFNPYDGIVAAAAAAAAAAATASAKASRLPLTARQHQILSHPAAGQVKASLRPLRQKISAMPRKHSHQDTRTIPIGGTLASTLHLYDRQRPQQQQQHEYQSGSILAQLLSSANRVLRHMTGSSGQRAPHRGNSSLAMASSNQVTPIHSEPNGHQLRLMPLYSLSQRANHHPLLDPLLYSLAAASENFAELATGSSSGYEPSPIESVGLYQAPVDSAKSSMDTYLASLIASSLVSAQQEHRQPDGGQVRNSSVGSSAAFSDNSVEWDSNSTAGGWSAAGSQDPANIVFASLGDNSNLLYPISTAPSGSLGSSSDQSELITMSPAESEIPSDEHIHFGFHQDAAAQTDLLESQIWNNIPEVQNFPESGQVESKLVSGKRAKAKKNSDKRVKLKEVVAERKPNKAPSEPHGEMQYALAHYVNADESLQLTDGKSPLVAYDVFDDGNSNNHKHNHNHNKALKFSQSLGSPAQTDAFRPMAHPHFYATYLDNNFRGALRAHDESADDSSTVRPARYPRGQRHQSQQQLSRPEDNRNNNAATSGSLSSTGQPTTTSTNQSQAGDKEAILQLGPQYSWPQYAASMMHQHPLLQLHHPPSPAASSHRPHVVAALASDLANLHRLHHHHHHHPLQHDLATSEQTARFTVSSPLGRTALLLHFWPLALALLPVMIIVAIVAQLIMAAPLVMFAFTTVALARLLGPGSSRELEPSRVGFLKRSSLGVADRLSAATLPGANNTKTKNETLVGAQEARRARAEKENEDKTTMDDYIRSLISKFTSG